MASSYHEFGPCDAVLPASNYPQVRVNQGANFSLQFIQFSPLTDEWCYFYFRVINYTTGNLTLQIDWYANDGSILSGGVVFEAAIAAITPETDTQDIESKAFAAASTFTDMHLGTEGRRLHCATITITGLDSIAAGDWCVLRLKRCAFTSGADNMASDCNVTKLVLSYTAT